MSFLARLDAYGTDDRQFREGHPEDRCPVCERPVVDHALKMYRGKLTRFTGYVPAKWPHRWAALRDIAFRYLTGSA